MNDPRKKLKLGRHGQGPRIPKSHYVTKGGQKIKLNRTLGSRMKARKDARLRNKAAYLATMPKGRFQRLLFRMHPKRVARYWFSRKGGIMALKITGIGILTVFLILVGVFAYFRKDLPNLHDISGNNIGGSNRYYDRTGQTLLWEDYDAVRRTPVQGQVAQVMKDATVSVEDKDFFKHGGFDVRGIARAGANNALGRGSTQGGSTITQQLVKLTQNWSKERTYSRKVKELILSVELERSYSKKEILNGYLDTAPYGDITYGVEAASKDYFQKSAKDLTLDEAAFMAAMPKSPTIFSPYGARYDRDELVARQHYILDLMAQQGKITTKQRDAAKKIDTLATLKPRQSNKYANITAPWFLKSAKEALIAERGADTVKLGGLKIITTLDLDKQHLAEEQVQKGLRQVQRQGGDTIAFTAEDVKTGQVVAQVGGTDFNDRGPGGHGELNYAHETPLSPGSSVKPYDYISVMENTDQFGAGSVLYDSQDPIIDSAGVGSYACTDKNPKTGNCAHDFDFRQPGPITLRYALGGSRNIPAIKAMATAGVDKTLAVANKLGVKDKGGTLQGSGYGCYKDLAQTTTPKPCGLSAAIGDGAALRLDEHVHGFSTIARNGKLLPQTYILKIQDAAGKTVSEWKPSAGKQAVRPDSAYIVADMMSDPNASYFGNPKPQRGPNGWKFGVKTGTTNDAKDGMLLGFSTDYAAGVWVGYHDRSRAMGGSMETMTAPIWSGWMREVHKNLPPEERPRPPGVQTLPAYVVRSHVGFGSIEPSPANDLYPSWYKARQKTDGKQTLDKVSNKVATDCTPARARQDVSNAAANLFASDKFHPGGGGTTASGEKDDIHKCEDAKPSITITAPPTCTGSCVFTATVTQGTHPLSSSRFAGVVNLKIGDQIKQTQNVSGSPTTLTFNVNANDTSDGTQSVSAEVVDSVLYDDVDSVSVSFSSAQAAGPTITSAKWSPTKITFGWTGGTSPVTIRRVAGSTALCTGSTGTCEASSVGTPVGTQIYAEDSTGAKSNPPATVNN